MRTHKADKRVLAAGRLLVCLAATLVNAPTSGHEVHGGHDHESPRPETAQALTHATRTDRLVTIEQLLRAFRASGDDAYLDSAWSRLEPALDEHNPNPRTLVDAALVAQARHDFAYALKLIDKALAVNDDDDQAWLLKASIHLVRGDADRAETACRALRHVPLLITMTCRARVEIARGNSRKAGRLLGALLVSIGPSATNSKQLAWAYAVAGDAAAIDSPDVAVAHFEQSLVLAENAQVRAALADVLIEAAELDKAHAVLLAGSPALPLQIRRFIVAKRLGRSEAITDEISAVDREFQRWIAAEDWLHAREMARFYLDVRERPRLARRLAMVNLSLQREPEDLRLERRSRSLTGAATAGPTSGVDAFTLRPTRRDSPTSPPLSLDVDALSVAVSRHAGSMTWSLRLFNPLDVAVLDEERVSGPRTLTEYLAKLDDEVDLDPRFGALVSWRW